MKTVAIISEYNPFHNGHLYQIEKIREEFGEDTAIIAIMSGNYTQRGEIAIMDKWKRAEAAVLCGVNLVVELPFPYSASSAEFFARAGVTIADRLGAVDYLSFGSELGDIDKLTEIALNSQKEEFKVRLRELLTSSEYSAFGYPKLFEIAYTELFGNENQNGLFLSNNILAIEYIKALRDLHSKIAPHTVKRDGGDYNSEEISLSSTRQSATAIRNLLSVDFNSAAEYVPNGVKNIMSSEINSGNFPCVGDRLSPAILSFFRLNSPTESANIHDTAGGLYNRLTALSFEATSISSLIALAATKKYTTARIRRAIWYSYLGVTSSVITRMPCYTQVLAMDKIGKALLKKIKKMTDFTVLTKPSSVPNSKDAEEQKKLSDKADFVFQMAKPQPAPADVVYKATPFVKKEV